MAVSLSSSPTIIISTKCYFINPNINNNNNFNNKNKNNNILPRVNLSRSSLSRFRICALSPQSKPPTNKDSGPASTKNLQDSARIFFAVLFWMALFFWSSVWDGRNDDGGTSNRPRKGSWFRR